VLGAYCLMVLARLATWRTNALRSLLLPRSAFRIPRWEGSAFPVPCSELGRLLAACCLLLAAASCGYHFVGSGGRVPGNIHSIAVDLPENRTAEAGIESLFANAFLNQFIRSNRLAVKPRAQADAVLSGTISSIETQAVSHLRPDKTLETRVTVTLALTLRRTGSSEILWQNQSLSYYQEYVETGNTLSTRQNRRRAIGDIAQFLAEKVYQNILEGF
jgi:hypothetical protein